MVGGCRKAHGPNTAGIGMLEGGRGLWELISSHSPHVQSFSLVRKHSVRQPNKPRSQEMNVSMKQKSTDSFVFKVSYPREMKAIIIQGKRKINWVLFQVSLACIILL